MLLSERFRVADDDKFFISIAKLLRLAYEVAPERFVHQTHIAKVLRLPQDYVEQRMDNAERWCIRFFKKCFRNERGIGYRFAESPTDAVIEATKTNLRSMAQMRSLMLTLKGTEYDYQQLKEENEALYELHLHNKMLATYVESTLLSQEKVLRSLSNEAQSISRKALIEASKPDFWSDLDE